MSDRIFGQKDLRYDKYYKKYGKTHVRTGDGYPALNSLDVVITEMTDAAAKISTCVKTGDFFIEHFEAGEILYIGGKNVTTSTGYPLAANTKLQLNGMKKNNNNEIYGICVASGTIDAYVVGAIKS